MKQRSETISGLMLIILLVFPLSAHAQGTDAESVLKAREAALLRSDLDAIVTLFADRLGRTCPQFASSRHRDRNSRNGRANPLSI